MTSEGEPQNGWPPKRVAALLLTLALAGLGLHTWRQEGDGRTLALLGMGVILGSIYTVRGGSLPPWLLKASQSHWVHGSGINADDDPSNLSPKLYLPILAAVILAAVILYLIYGRR